MYHCKYMVWRSSSIITKCLTTGTLPGTQWTYGGPWTWLEHLLPERMGQNTTPRQNQEPRHTAATQDTREHKVGVGVEPQLTFSGASSWTAWPHWGRTCIWNFPAIKSGERMWVMTYIHTFQHNNLLKVNPQEYYLWGLTLHLSNCEIFIKPVHSCSGEEHVIQQLEMPFWIAGFNVRIIKINQGKATVPYITPEYTGYKTIGM